MYILVRQEHINFNIQQPPLCTFHSYILLSNALKISWKAMIIFWNVWCWRILSIYHVYWGTLPWIISIKIILLKNLQKYRHGIFILIHVIITSWKLFILYICDIQLKFAAQIHMVLQLHWLEIIYISV